VNVPLIHPPFEAFYIDNLLRLTSAGVKAIQAIEQWRLSLETPSAPDKILSAEDILGYHEDLLLAGAGLSRYFWPVGRSPKTLYVNRARQLRQALDIADDSPLKDRDLRNGLEHFDERLDDFLAQFRAGNVIPNYIGPRLKLGDMVVHIFRGVITDSGKFVLLGKEYEIAPLANAVAQLHRRLQNCCKSGFRFPSSGESPNTSLERTRER
jgi:hypothetical protein